MLQLLTYIRWCDSILDGEFGASCRSQMPFAKHMLSAGWYYGLKYHSDSFGQSFKSYLSSPGYIQSCTSNQATRPRTFVILRSVRKQCVNEARSLITLLSFFYDPRISALLRPMSGYEYGCEQSII
ncbi:hypothetical protein FOYG_09629 [Fusarium oxysporum NRRL 32931]|uniref:Uncharacterized protein n=1 Tax=Fusarium oxysporum NRRL 32931 TaxID=660029 RepID=W9I7J0_FUSOX|nr:hypothetical protein FOYG_09629 [Fusarium oxysporum NRRL 32931]